MELENYSRVVARVDLSAIENNMDIMHGMIQKESKMIGVIKTDGYGHGSVPIAKVLQNKAYMFGFAVATPEEAFVLRKAGIENPILILGYSFPYSYEQMILQDIRPCVFRMDMAEKLSKVAVSLGKKAKIHIKADTGMARIGISPDEAGLDMIKKISALDGIEIEGLFTHFARADEVDKTAFHKQLDQFNSFVDIVKKAGLKVPYIHCSNSAAIMDCPEANMNIVRAGITLYGIEPSNEVPVYKKGIRPALSLHSKIVYVKQIPKGTAVSYGGTFVAGSDMNIATIPVGYGDGYPRSLSNKGYVLIHGEKAPILGRICMDQFMVDVSHIPDVREGDDVVLIGRQGGEYISIEFLGELSQRFPYELACDLGKRIPRAYYYRDKLVCTKDYYFDEYPEMNWQ